MGATELLTIVKAQKQEVLLMNCVSETEEAREQ